MRRRSLVLTLAIIAVLALASTQTMRGNSNADRDTDSLSRGLPALRLNLLHAAAGAANAGFEIPVSSRLSLGGYFGLKTWPRTFVWDGAEDAQHTRKWKHIAAAPELRFWPGGVFNNGWFFGTDLLWTHYNTGDVRFPLGLYKDVRKERQQGDFYGAGLFAGYSLRLGRTSRWRVEAELGAAGGYNSGRRYDCSKCGSRIGDKKGPVVIPKLALNLVFDFGKPKAPVREEEAGETSETNSRITQLKAEVLRQIRIKTDKQ